VQKIHLFFIFLTALAGFFFIMPATGLAQQKTKIILQHADVGGLSGTDKISYLKNPVFRHAGAVLTCDSAVLYEERNAFEAFQNVHIIQGDTINIYADHLVYEGNTKIAHLTSNVRMIDKESVLTTNILDYNMGTKVGTYVEGGKIVNKDVTLTSRNGYYFSNSRDSYFRYNVVVVTPETRITSDTLRYNTLTNWAYFYGPTNIKGKGDNLYTENGAYNTKTEYAYFGKKNLYTNASKSLKGDSLYYDGIAGYGKAVRNIVFRDTSDKTVLYGQLGYYYKKDERAVVTKNAYVGMGTNDSITVNKKMVPDSIWMGADTLETQMVLRHTLKLLEFPVLKKDNELGEEERPDDKSKDSGPVTLPVKSKASPGKGLAPVSKLKPPAKKASKRKKNKDALKNAQTDSLFRDSVLKREADSLFRDSLLKLQKDSIVKDSLLKQQKDSLSRDSLLKLKKDSLVKNSPVAKAAKATGLKAKDTAIKAAAKVAVPDTTLAGRTDTTINKTGPPGKEIDSLLKKTDSIPADTVKTRVIKAFHHVKVFKTNMQALADSLFYTSADSTLRWFGSPILWSQGSQQTGDTIYLRLKNKKLNTLQVLENGFLVNVNADSAKFNQVKGKLFTAFFTNGELSNMFVDGNAESIYYVRDKDSVYTDLSQTVSARIKILFKNKEITNLLTIKDAEGVKMPVSELTEEKLLTGFIWKPESRPLSKKEVILGKAKPATNVQAKSATKKITVKNGKAVETIIDKSKPGLKDLLKTKVPDSIPVKIPDSIPAKIPDSLAAKPDTLKKAIKPGLKKADSLLKKEAPAVLKKQ